MLGQVNLPFLWRQGNEDSWMPFGNVEDAKDSIGKQPDGYNGAEERTHEPCPELLYAKEDNQDCNCYAINGSPAQDKSPSCCQRW